MISVLYKKNELHISILPNDLDVDDIVISPKINKKPGFLRALTLDFVMEVLINTLSMQI